MGNAWGIAAFQSCLCERLIRCSHARVPTHERGYDDQCPPEQDHIAPMYTNHLFLLFEVRRTYRVFSVLMRHGRVMIPHEA